MFSLFWAIVHVVIIILIIVMLLSKDDFEDDAAKSLAVCLNFCLIDDLIIPCIFKDRCVTFESF